MWINTEAMMESTTKLFRRLIANCNILIPFEGSVISIAIFCKSLYNFLLIILQVFWLSTFFYYHSNFYHDSTNMSCKIYDNTNIN